MDEARTNQEILSGMDSAHARACRAQRDLFRFIAEAQRRELWWADGARDMAHMVGSRYRISNWKAQRWVEAARALESLPIVAEAFSSGVLAVDQVVELTRFATPEDESELVEWARNAPSGAIRAQGDLRARRAREDAESIERSRRLDWWFHDEGRQFSMVADLPAADGAVVARAIERIAGTIPLMPNEEDPCHAPARRADALVALASTRISEDPHPDRAAVIVHVPAEVLAEAAAKAAVTEAQAVTEVLAGGPAGATTAPGPEVPMSFAALPGPGEDEILGGPGCRITPGGVIPADTVMRLLCHCRLHGIVEDSAGDLVRMARVSRDPPEWMMRQLRYRDGGCTFPGCGERRWTRAHHIRWWTTGGPTEMWNLVLVCHWHHKLVHELGWSLTRDADGTVRWYTPDGRRYRAGPAPPTGRSQPQLALA